MPGQLDIARRVEDDGTAGQRQLPGGADVGKRCRRFVGVGAFGRETGEAEDRGTERTMANPGQSQRAL